MMAPIEGGKSLKEIDRGCVAFFPDRAFFCIYYGDLQDEEVSITVIGQLYADDDFIDEMEKCRYRQGDVMEIYDPETGIRGTTEHKFMIDTEMDWMQLPPGIKRVYQKRGIALPGGPVINADGEARKISDFIYTFYTSVINGEKYEMDFIAKLLDYYAFKIGGWCGLNECADDILKYKELLLVPNADLEAILVDFIYYVNKMSMWIDLLIPWEDVTELMRRPDDRPNIGV